MITDVARIEHILEAIKRIRGFVAGANRDSFLSNPAIQDAVAYNITIIGEAVRCMSDEFKAAHPDVPWKQIHTMRNILIHDYLRTDVDQLWRVVQNDLDDLNAKLDAIKSSASQSPQ